MGKDIKDILDIEDIEMDFMDISGPGMIKTPRLLNE